MSDTSSKKKARRTELTLREIRFAEHYVEYGVASDAYTAAGYPARPRESVHVLSWRLLRRAPVRDLIRTLRQEALDASRISVNRLAQGLARIAFANRADLFDEHGCLLPAHQWPADVAATVEGVDTEEVFAVVSEKGQPKRRELRGHSRKVRTAKRTEAMKILATWRRMIGRDAEVEAMDAEIQRLREVLEQLKGSHGAANPG